MRPRVVLTTSVATVVAGGALLVAVANAQLPFGVDDIPPGDFLTGSSPTAAESPTPDPAVARVSPAPVAIDTDDFWSWALIELDSGAVTGAPNLDATSTTASMIKPWLAADFLRRATEAGSQPSEQRLADISVMIRDSENDPATQLYDELGGAESINRLIERCGLTDSAPSWRWSLTELSARDAARMGACIADGRAAGPEWTDWLLDEMRQVRGQGDFGIRKAFPEPAAAGIAIKNGYFPRPEDGMWHLNCLAVGEEWAMAVIQRYPEALGLEHGAGICREVAAQLRADGADPSQPSQRR